MISERLQELYEPYLQGNEHFVPCGVVDEEAYLSSEPKLVILLREVNDPQQKRGWSVPGFLRGQVRRGLDGKSIYPMWKRVGIWSYAIHNGFPRYKDLDSSRTAVEGLKLIGMTNLKKSGGGGLSNMKVIRKCAEETVGLWKQELEIMDPEIILCGRTYRIVTELLGLKHKQMASGLWYSIWQRCDRCSLVVQFYHPSYRGSSHMLYALLKEGFLELREKALW